MRNLSLLIIGILSAFILNECYDFSIPPVLDNVSSEEVCIYDEIDIYGRFFGIQDENSRVILAAEDGEYEMIIVDWDDRHISVSIPSDLVSRSKDFIINGDLYVKNIRGVSNSINISLNKPFIKGYKGGCAGETMTIEGDCLGDSSKKDSQPEVVIYNIETRSEIRQRAIGAHNNHLSFQSNPGDKKVRITVRVPVEGSLIPSNAYEIEYGGSVVPFSENVEAKLIMDKDGGGHIFYNGGEGNIMHTYTIGQSCWLWPYKVLSIGSESGYEVYYFNDDYIHLVYGSSKESACYHRIYDLNSKGWSNDNLISRVECRAAPILTKNYKSGDILAYWSWGSTKYALFSMTDGRWGETRAIKWDGESSCQIYPDEVNGCKAWHPLLKFGPSGLLYAMFSRGLPADNLSNELRFIVSYDSGRTWGNLNVIDRKTALGDFEIDYSGNIHLVYPLYTTTSDNKGGYKLRYIISSDNGSKWNTITTIEDSLRDTIFAPRILLDKGSMKNIVFVWEDKNYYFALWDNSEKRLYERSPIALKEEPEYSEDTHIIGLSNDSIVYAIINERLLFGRFLYIGGVDLDIIKDNMTFVPAGPSKMGSEVENGRFDEKPQHIVRISPFYIDRYEVTNADYRECVSAGICSEPLSKNSRMRKDYYDSYENFPVIYVNWYQADTYCKWRGKRLPTEAEWEKASVGSGGSKYPWGDAEANCDYANGYFSPGGVDVPCKGDTTPVGSYPLGVSKTGAYDLAGNVSEWVYDFYNAYYYQNSPSVDPQGPSEGSVRSVRGGSFFSNKEDVRSQRRYYEDPKKGSDILGFRCAKSAYKVELKN
jgi:formylglycine-generating enzyme required for sulfatase activity